MRCRVLDMTISGTWMQRRCATALKGLACVRPCGLCGWRTRGLLLHVCLLFLMTTVHVWTLRNEVKGWWLCFLSAGGVGVVHITAARTTSKNFSKWLQLRCCLIVSFMICRCFCKQLSALEHVPNDQLFVIEVEEFLASWLSPMPRVDVSPLFHILIHRPSLFRIAKAQIDSRFPVFVLCFCFFLWGVLLWFSVLLCGFVLLV